MYNKGKDIKLIILKTGKMKSQKTTSIYEIADLTGVSASTVSRVINNDNRVSVTTVKKVRDAMEKLKYIPVPVAKRRGRKPANSGTLRIVLYSEIWVNHEVVKGISAAVEESNVEILLQDNSSGNYQPEELLQKKIDGIIFWGTPEKLIKSGVLSRIPAVNIFGHKSMHPIKCDMVTYNNRSVSQLAVDYLVSKQVRQAVAIAPADNEIAEERVKCFEKEMRNSGIPYTSLVEPMVEAYSGTPSEQLKSLLKDAQAVTGFFAYNDNLALHLHIKLLNCGKVPGKDYIIVSCDNNREMLSAISPRPASVDIHFYEIGRQAGEKILWRMKNPVNPACSIVIEPQLVQ